MRTWRWRAAGARVRPGCRRPPGRHDRDRQLERVPDGAVGRARDPEVNPEALERGAKVVRRAELHDHHRADGARAAAPRPPVSRHCEPVVLPIGSRAGAKGVRELAEQVEKLHGMEDDLAHPDPAALPVGEVFGKTIAYNVIAKIDVFDAGSGFTFEEIKVEREGKRILRCPGSTSRRPAFGCRCRSGHSVSLHARFERPLSVIEARELLERAEGVQLRDDPANDVYPSPLEAAGIDDVLVGTDPPAGGARRRAVAVRLRRQPPQGRRAQRGADRRARDRGQLRAPSRPAAPAFCFGDRYRAGRQNDLARRLRYRSRYRTASRSRPLGAPEEIVHPWRRPAEEPSQPRRRRLVHQPERHRVRRPRGTRCRARRASRSRSADPTRPATSRGRRHRHRPAPVRDHPPRPSVLREQRVLDRQHDLLRHRRVPASLDSAAANVEQPQHPPERPRRPNPLLLDQHASGCAGGPVNFSVCPRPSEPAQVREQRRPPLHRRRHQVPAVDRVLELERPPDPSRT